MSAREKNVLFFFSTETNTRPVKMLLQDRQLSSQQYRKLQAQMALIACGCGMKLAKAILVFSGD